MSTKKQHPDRQYRRTTFQVYTDTIGDFRAVARLLNIPLRNALDKAMIDWLHYNKEKAEQALIKTGQRLKDLK